MENNNIDLLNKMFDRHFWNQIKEVDSYEKLPKVFRRNNMMRENAFNSYSNKGQFFSINTKHNHYLVLLHNNGGITAMDDKVYEVGKSQIESDLKLVYLGLSLEEVLTHSIRRKMTESDMSRLVKMIIK
jgi:uncharacterized protein YxeA